MCMISGAPNVVAEPSTYSVAGLTSAIDVDADGDLDLLHDPSGEALEVFWHENLDGKGQFCPTLTASGPHSDPLNGPRDVDVDGDGDLDVVPFQRWQTSNHGFENLGDGVLAQWSTLPVDQQF